MFRQQKGPISMWISLAEKGKTLSLVLFLCSHTHVLECLELVARHYAPALDDYERASPREIGRGCGSACRGWKRRSYEWTDVEFGDRLDLLQSVCLFYPPGQHPLSFP